MKKIKKVQFFAEKSEKIDIVKTKIWLILCRRIKSFPIFAARKRKGSLAQLVQSIALTRRGSLVRVQQFPQNIKITR